MLFERSLAVNYMRSAEILNTLDRQVKTSWNPQTRAKFLSYPSASSAWLYIPSLGSFSVVHYFMVL